MMPTVLERRYEHLLPSIERNPYLPADRPQGFFIAINLFNSKAVIPHLFQTLLSISALLGPSNVHIAIFENGSWDETVPAMAHFARALTALGETSHTPLSLSALAYQVHKVSILSLSKGVAHSIRSDAHQTDWEHVDRIAQLAEYRNVALQPLTDFDLSSPNGKPIFNPPFVNSSLPHPTVPTDVLFINDIFVCPTDILELLHQRRFQDASATCGLDWREAPEGSMWRWLKGWLSKNYRFYDSEFPKRIVCRVKLIDFFFPLLGSLDWVTRSMEGFPLRPRVDMFGELRDGVRELFHWDRDPTYLIRWRAALPLPVYSCWNGMIVLDASPFLPSSSLPLSQAHPSHEPFKFRNGDEAVGECAASECKLIARDFWGVGKKRWVLVPRVAVTYDEEGYKAKWIEERVRRGGVLGMMEDLEVKKFRHAPSEAMELEEKIDWSLVKDPEQVVCFPFHQGSRLEVRRSALLLAFSQLTYAPFSIRLISTDLDLALLQRLCFDPNPFDPQLHPHSPPHPFRGYLLAFSLPFHSPFDYVLTLSSFPFQLLSAALRLLSFFWLICIIAWTSSLLSLFIRVCDRKKWKCHTSCRVMDSWRDGKFV
jgi:hypothetical protein